MTAMKRNIIIVLAAALLAVSCENTVETIWSDQNEAMLVLNAQLIQDSPIHLVYVHCSEGGQNNEILDAEVFYSKNGGAEKPVAPISHWEEWYDGSLHEENDGYGFEETFAAGDRVTLKARWHGLTATGEITFPESAAKITAVDTATAEMCGRVIYPAAVLNVSEHQTEAQAFLDYLKGSEASAVFESVGFTALS